MIRTTTFATASALALMVLIPGAARAQGPDTRDRTIMTFSGAAEMPGLTLQAGAYVFKVADTALRNVVQVWDRDERNILGQWFFIPAERRESTDDTLVAFRETPAGTTPAIQYWYYPGQLRGKEFIYPKDQASRIARATGGRVITGEGDSATRVASIDAQGRTTEWQAPAAYTPPPANTPAPARVSPTPQPAAQAAAPAPYATPRATQPEYQVAQNELPQTASPLALTGIIALASLGASMMLRASRRRQTRA